MPRPKKAVPTRRIHIELPEDVIALLDEIQKRTYAASQSEVIRRALLRWKDET